MVKDRTFQVAIIGGSHNRANGVGTVVWKRKDDNGKLHTFEVNNILYFLDFPVNILSVTKFAEQLNDDHATGCDTKRNYSILHWDNKIFQRMTKHPASNLPELIANEGWSIFHIFSKVVKTKVHLGKQFYHCHSSHLIPDDDVELPQSGTSTQVNVDEGIFMWERHCCIQRKVTLFT